LESETALAQEMDSMTGDGWAIEISWAPWLESGLAEELAQGTVRR